MSDMPSAPRHWALAGLAGAAVVILPTALGFAGWQAARLHEALAQMGPLVGEAEPGPSAALMAVQTFVTVAVIASLIGLPIAFLLTGAMALVERSRPGACTLNAWLAASVVAALPLGIPLLLLTDSPSLLLALLALALVGGAFAWLVRHGLRGARA